MKEYNSAIADFSKAIEIKSDNADVFYKRGIAKTKLEDYKGAITDYTESIMLDSTYTYGYSERGIARENIEDFEGACEDWRKAASLGHYASAQWVKDSCN